MRPALQVDRPCGPRHLRRAPWSDLEFLESGGTGGMLQDVPKRSHKSNKLAIPHAGGPRPLKLMKKESGVFAISAVVMCTLQVSARLVFSLAPACS